MTAASTGMVVDALGSCKVIVDDTISVEVTVVLLSWLFTAVVWYRLFTARVVYSLS